MPTLLSIGVHPRLVEKLSNLEPSIDTPMALLSRDPQWLAEALKVPLGLMEQVRAAVAGAMVVKTDFGSCALHVQACLPPSMTTDTGSSATKNCSFPLEGSLSAGDMQRYHQSILTNPISLPHCRGWNRLLAFPDNTILSSSHGSISSAAVDNNNNNNCGGGVPFGHITQVSGAPSTGKTQLALLLAATHAASATSASSSSPSVHYLASGYGHGSVYPLARRLKHLCTKDNFLRIIDGVCFDAITDAYQLLARIKQLEHKLKQEQQQQQPTLLIIDSASGCLASDLYRGSVELVRSVSTALQRLAHNFSVAVFVTNGTVSSNDQQQQQHSIKPALGQTWNSTADIQVWLEAVPSSLSHENKVIRAWLNRHPTKPWHQQRETTMFGIVQGGIVDCDELSQRALLP